MATTRENSTGQGAHEYTEGKYTITCMGGGGWVVFIGKSDTGHGFKTLREARKWCKDEAEEANSELDPKSLDVAMASIGIEKQDGPSYAEIMERFNLDRNNGASD